MGKRRVWLVRHPDASTPKLRSLRTETWYKAGEVRRVSTTSRSRCQTTTQVNHEPRAAKHHALIRGDLHSLVETRRRSRK